MPPPAAKRFGGVDSGPASSTFSAKTAFQAWGANAIHGFMHATVPIPQGVTDFVFLVQFVIYEGTEFKLSQVYGAPIH